MESSKNLNSSVMETETIQKNRASLKSLMSKGIKYIVVAIGFVAFYGCAICADAVSLSDTVGPLTFERDTIELIYGQKYKLELTGVPDWMTIVEKLDDNLYTYEAIISENESTESRQATIHGSISKDVKTECTVSVSGLIRISQPGKSD
jgi:hypothetical protein